MGQEEKKYRIEAVRSEMIRGGWYGIVIDTETGKTVFASAIKTGPKDRWGLTARKRALRAARRREE